jgi:hypothetical protein
MSLVPVAACRCLSLAVAGLVVAGLSLVLSLVSVAGSLSLVHCKSNQTHLNKHSKFKNYAAAQFF